MPRSAINEELTQRIAKTARLRLSTEEARGFTEQLRGILVYLDRLGELDLSGVEPLIQPGPIPAQLREDVARQVDPEGANPLLVSAPEVVDEGYKVPPIL